MDDSFKESSRNDAMLEFVCGVFPLPLSFLKQRELNFCWLKDGQQGAALVLLGRVVGQDPGHPGFAPAPTDLADVDAVEVAKHVLEGNPEDAVVVAVS